MNESQPSSDRERNAAAAEEYRLRQAEKHPEALHAVEADEEKARAEATAEPPAETQGVTEKVKTWNVLQEHPIAKELDIETRLALLCEYIDLGEDLEGMPLTDFIMASLAPDAGEMEHGPEVVNAEPSDYGDVPGIPAGPSRSSTWTVSYGPT